MKSSCHHRLCVSNYADSSRSLSTSAIHSDKKTLQFDALQDLNEYRTLTKRGLGAKRKRGKLQVEIAIMVSSDDLPCFNQV